MCVCVCVCMRIHVLLSLLQISTPASATNKYVVHLPPTHRDTSSGSISQQSMSPGSIRLATPASLEHHQQQQGASPQLIADGIKLSSSHQSVVVKELSVDIHRQTTDDTAYSGM